MFLAYQRQNQANQPQQEPHIVCAVERISIFRRDAWLLHQISFQVASGECWLLTGQNGSGKTTLLRIVAGLCLSDEGKVTHYPCLYNSYHDASLLYIASPSAKIPELSVVENLQFHALLRWGSHPVPAIIDEALNYWGIAHLSAQPLANLSQGQQQRVTLALLLLGPAQLWLLDEPTTALDAAGINALWTLCRHHQKQGGSIMMATHQEPHDMLAIRRVQLGIYVS